MLFVHCFVSSLTSKKIIHYFSMLIIKVLLLGMMFMILLGTFETKSDNLSLCNGNYTDANSPGCDCVSVSVKLFQGSDLGLVANRNPQLGHQSALAGSKINSRLFMILTVLGFSPDVTALLSSLTGLCVTRRWF